MRLEYFTYNNLSKVILYLNDRYIGNYILSDNKDTELLNYDINWCHRELNKRIKN